MTIKEIKELIYKKFKINNNLYKLEEQFEKITEVHNCKNIDNCVSLNEISFVLNYKPSNQKILKFEMCKKEVKTDFFINFMKELKNLNQSRAF
jgi:hypothetical protein